MHSALAHSASWLFDPKRAVNIFQIGQACAHRSMLISASNQSYNAGHLLLDTSQIAATDACLQVHSNGLLEPLQDDHESPVPVVPASQQYLYATHDAPCDHDDDSSDAMAPTEYCTNCTGVLMGDLCVVRPPLHTSPPITLTPFECPHMPVCVRVRVCIRLLMLLYIRCCCVSKIAS